MQSAAALPHHAQRAVTAACQPSQPPSTCAIPRRAWRALAHQHLAHRDEGKVSQPRAAAPATGAANCSPFLCTRATGGPGESSSRRASAPTRNASSRPLQTPHTDDLPWEPLRRSSLYRHSEHSLPPRASSQRRRRTAVTGCRCRNFGCLLQRLCAALRRMRAAPAPRRGQADADDNKPTSCESLNECSLRESPS